MKTELELFHEAMRFRGAYKRLQQFSFQIKETEERYPLEAMTNEELKFLLKIYADFIPEVEKVLIELKQISEVRGK